MIISREIFIDQPTHPHVPWFHLDFEIKLQEIIDAWWENFLHLEHTYDCSEFAIVHDTASTSSPSTTVEYHYDPIPPYLKDNTFVIIAHIFSAFTIRTSDILTATPTITDTHAISKLLFRLHHDVRNIQHLQDHRDLHDIYAPAGWIDPQDNNDSSFSQVNVLDVRSTPSTYNTRADLYTIHMS